MANRAVMKMRWSVVFFVLVFYSVLDCDGAEDALRKVDVKLPVKLGVILPKDDTHLFSQNRVAPAIEIGVETAKRRWFSQSSKFKTSYGDSKCSGTHGPLQAIDFYSAKVADVFLGPVCDYAAAPVARFSPFWNIPMLTAGALVKAFQQKQDEYKLLTRMNGSYQKLGHFIVQVLANFHWNMTGLVYHNNLVQTAKGHSQCYFTAEGIFFEVKGWQGSGGKQPWFKSFDQVHFAKDKNVRDLLEEIRQNARRRSVGLVTDVPINHATPSPLYAKSAHRKWMADFKMAPEVRDKCKDIAKQMVEDYPGTNLSVMLGAGLPFFRPTPPAGSRRSAVKDRQAGQRLDGRDLVGEWQLRKRSEGKKFKFVKTSQDLEGVRPQDADYLLGLFDFDDYYQYPNNTDKDAPTISEMAQKAVKILSNNKDGFFLLVEGGRADWAHHHNLAYRAMDEILGLSRAVQDVLDLPEVDLKETLVIVTADHSHPFVMAGQPLRTQNIFDPVVEENGVEIALDGKPYTSFLYGTGPGGINGTRGDPSLADTRSPNYIQQALVPMKWGSHGGEDVPIYATGAMAHLFRGSQEQNFVAEAMAAAGCMKEYKNSATHCKNNQGNRAGQLAPSHAFVIIFVIVSSVFKKC